MPGMSSRRVFLQVAALPALGLAQDSLPPIHPRDEDRPQRLPNGKLQQDEILKDDYRKTLEDCKELVKQAQDLQADVEKNEQYILSLSTIKRTEDIEKLARRIRGRMKKA